MLETTAHIPIAHHTDIYYIGPYRIRTVMEQRHIALLLNDAARAYRAGFERRARRQKVTLMQWRTLVALSKRNGISQTALAQAVEASPMTMSDILDRLESRGWVRREPDPDDSRAKRVTIQPIAMPLADDLRQVAQAISAQALDGIPPDEVETFTSVLTRIIANLGAAETSKDRTDER